MGFLWPKEDCSWEQLRLVAYGKNEVCYMQSLWTKCKVDVDTIKRLQQDYISDDGEIKIVEDKNKKLVWECPNCKNHDQATMNVARRTCGYIGTQYWNQGRTQEIKERVLHL